MIGAILGVGVANSLTAGHVFGDGVNWTKAGEIGISLLVYLTMRDTLAASRIERELADGEV